MSLDLYGPADQVLFPYRHRIGKALGAGVAGPWRVCSGCGRQLGQHVIVHFLLFLLLLRAQRVARQRIDPRSINMQDVDL
jgi:hypothetical protein